MKILIRPIISEKTISDTANGKFTFEVAKNANKHQIAEAVKSFYKVSPLEVNIIRIKPEQKSVRGKYKIFTKEWKKAIVKLKKGEKIEGFEIKE